ncbi:MAG TPA: right-handed parallel beta-helix repeat-containing protein [Pedobacter sp.]|uniref:right-handed parallel beta-helix repeat-containing protein n=1 Tax=Pedobacter sp. TaxID=1411316 RepID=UPI002B7D3A79|nr:right-handed parallel beta-helix repeat-containing protein [Pedobacter sp.]HMI02800.1 right-handed parallel beta-helix repeat-containing protein [Pedobacter sp.]
MIQKQCILSVLTVGLLFFQFNRLAASSIQGKGKIINVAKTGKDSNEGTATAPLLTIGKAETMAQPGDRIVVHKGIYRETIVLHSGGTSDAGRIVYVAAPGDEVIIKGSESIKEWKKNGNTWRAEIDNSFFTDFNPFTELVNKDSSSMHLGEVYLENEPLKEKKSLDEVGNLENSWYTVQGNGKTIIIANFGQNNPNLKLAEINVRQSAFSAEKPGVNYISIDGFSIAHIASPPAFVNGAQAGAISTNGGTHWSVQNCILRDCKSVAISIGQTGHAYPGASPNKPQYSDLSQDMNTVGHHLIKHNHIFRCGQAGVFGLLHGTRSEITDNLIEDINGEGDYPVSESGGIRLVLAVDVLISHNLIRRVHGESGYGLFLGPLFQGARISRNVIADTRKSCIYLYNSHGPALIDNNILSGPGISTREGVKMISAEANVFVQNLFYNCGFTNNRAPGRSFATSNFLSHSLVIKQTIPALPIDNRWYSNLFIKGGLEGLNDAANCEADYNVYADGASMSSWGDKHSKRVNTSSNFKLVSSAKQINLIFDSHLVPKILSPELNPAFLGFFTLSKQYLELPDGRPITVNKDFRAALAGKTAKLAGPFYQYPVPAVKGQLLFAY